MPCRHRNRVLKGLTFLRLNIAKCLSRLEHVAIITDRLMCLSAHAESSYYPTHIFVLQNESGIMNRFQKLEIVPVYDVVLKIKSEINMNKCINKYDKTAHFLVLQF